MWCCCFFFRWWWKFIWGNFLKNELSLWVAQRCHQSLNHMQVKNVLRDTQNVSESDASKLVTNGHVKPRHFCCIVYKHTHTHTFWQRLRRAIFWNQQNSDHLLHKHEWNRHICWSNPLTTLISLSPLYCCRNWIGCVSFVYGIGKKVKSIANKI